MADFIPASSLITKCSEQEGDELVTKFVDFSSKYGIGYKLSNGAFGVLFNDSTKIVVAHKDVVFYYYERRAVSQTEKQDVQTKYSFSDYPREL